MLSHRALYANHEQLATIEPAPIGPDDVVLLAVPLFHAYGLNSGLGAVAYHGATGVLIEAFDPAESLRLIAAHQVTAVLGVPTMFLAWSLLSAEAADRPGAGDGFASVRVAVSGAAPLEASTARRFLEVTRHPILVGYGLTESAPVLTTTLASPVPKDGSIGRAIPGVDVKLVSAGGDQVWRSTDGPGDQIDFDDFDDDASGSPGTDPGEIVVRGANLFSGYWPDGRDGPDADGWWATGDVAYADADGDLFLVDRLRELILVNGFNVYPREVENVLTAHPAVAAAAVLGVPHPYTGQTVKAYVVTSAPVGVDELMQHCERNLARFKCPSAIEFAAELPRSATGKVRKAALRSGDA
jgi:long-chain acyl-CoA synthetase